MRLITVEVLMRKQKKKKTRMMDFDTEFTKKTPTLENYTQCKV